MSDSTIARHDERITTLDGRVSLLDSKLDNLAREVHEIKLLLAEGKGKISGAVMIVTAISSVAGAAVGLITYFLNK